MKGHSTKWDSLKLSEVCEITPSKKEVSNLDSKTEVSFLPMASVSESGNITTPEVRKLKDVIKGFTYFREGDVLLAKITPCFENGKKAIAKDLINRIGFGSTEFHVLRPGNKVTSGWIFYGISKDDFRNAAKSKMTGTAGQKRVPKRIVEQYEIPVPSIEEQNVIVDEIETQFTRLDAVVKSLSSLKRKLDVYRKSVLKAAFEGRLSEEYRMNHNVDNNISQLLLSQGIEVKKLDNPIGWIEVSLNKAIKIIDYRGRTPPFSEVGISHLRSANIRDGMIIWEKLKYVSKETYQKYMTRGLPKNGDLLFTTEAPLGEIAPTPDQKFSLAQRIVLLRPKENILLPDFLLYQIRSDRFQSKLRIKKTGTTVSGVSSRNFKTLELSIPSLQEQEVIINEIESRFSVIDKIEQTVDASLKKADQLRKSILKSAFEGKLVKYEGDNK